jgi:lipoprotein NlpI
MATILALLSLASTGDTVAELRRQFDAATAKGNYQDALRIAEKAIELNPSDAMTFAMRGVAHAGLRKRVEAVRDFTKAIEQRPDFADAFQQRGAERFKLGKIDESIADFDKYILLKPDAEPGHWQRGISLYYAGRFAEGAKQFKAYEQRDTNDVENAVWHYLCNARVVGKDKAAESILRIGKDRRVPLMEVYALFQGRGTREEVLAASEKGNPNPLESTMQTFYAHLYLGLYAESRDDAAKALEHMTKAVAAYGKMPSEHYMGEVARVHLDRLHTQSKEKREGSR